MIKNIKLNKVMNNVLLSIVIITYNCLDFLKRNEIINSNLEHVEIIVIDDGSTDGTEEYLKNNRNIKYYRKKNSGYGPSVNVGINCSSGKYIRILDGDDTIEINQIIEFTKKIREYNVNSDCILTNYKDNICYNKNIILKDKIDFSNLVEFKIYHLNTNNDLQKMKKYFLLKTVIFKRELISKINFYFKKNIYANDNNFVYFPLVYVNDIIFINNVMYIYNIWGESQSTSLKNKNNFMNSIFQIYLSFLKFFVFHFYKKRILFIFWQSIFFLDWYVREGDYKTLNINKKISYFFSILIKKTIFNGAKYGKKIINFLRK